jgi:SAM-dependent methyltransferase
MKRIQQKARQLWALITVLARRAKPAFLPNSIYSRALPTDQAAVDLFRGEWASRLPGDLKAGAGPMFDEDARPRWFINQIGGVQGKSVLDLGPLEGGHSFQLESHGAQVTAIEGNQLAFLRCLIAKNTLGMKTKFYFGDFIQYLDTTNDRFDAVFASGVLYHMQEPLKVLRSMCRVTDHLYLWTHHYDHAAIQADPQVRRAFKSGSVKNFELDGAQATGHEHRYTTGLLTYFMPGFCGGMKRYTYWIELEAIQNALRQFGFDIVGVELNPASTPHGPNVSIAARRRLSATS